MGRGREGGRCSVFSHVTCIMELINMGRNSCCRSVVYENFVFVPKRGYSQLNRPASLRRRKWHTGTGERCVCGGGGGVEGGGMDGGRRGVVKRQDDNVCYDC